jgi:hypothetical protein
MSTGGFSSRVKAAVAEADHSPPATAQVKKLTLPHTSSRRSVSLLKYRENFTVLYIPKNTEFVK